MCPFGYYTMLRQSKDRIYLRFELVRYARAHGIKPAARHFSTRESLQVVDRSPKVISGQPRNLLTFTFDGNILCVSNG